MKTLLRIATGGLTIFAIVFMFIVLTGATSSVEVKKDMNNAAFVINPADGFTIGLGAVGSGWSGPFTLIINNGGQVNFGFSGDLVSGPGVEKGVNIRFSQVLFGIPMNFKCSFSPGGKANCHGDEAF